MRRLSLGAIVPMTKRRLIRWSLILAIFAAFAVWLEPTRVVWGWLRGEAFYQGRPTSWWRQELSQWKMHEVWMRNSLEWCASQRRLEMGFERSDTRFEKVADWISVQILRGEPAPLRRIPAILDFDSAAEAVLTELCEDSSQEIRDLANFGLERARGARAMMDANQDDGNQPP